MAGGPEIRQSVSYTGPLVNSLERLVGNAGDGNDLAIAAAQPWRGTPPMGWSPTTTRLIERLERSIAGRDPTAARPRGRTILRIIRIGRRDSPGSQHHRDRPRLRVPPSHSPTQQPREAHGLSASPQTGIECFVYLTGEVRSPRPVAHVTHRFSDVVTTVVSAEVVSSTALTYRHLPVCGSSFTG